MVTSEKDRLTKENRSYKDEVDTLNRKVGEYGREYDDLKILLDRSGSEANEIKSKVCNIVIMILQFGFNYL